MSRLNDESDDFGQGYMFNKRYRLVEELTPGGQARVFVVEDIDSSNKKKVIKMVDTNEHKDVKNEIDLLKTLRNISEYIINYYDDFRFYGIKHCIVTEYCQNKDLAFELEQYKRENVKIKDHKIEYWNNEIIEGLCFLHENGIIHRDIKPQNIFVTEKGDLKIGDLGYSRKTADLISKSRQVGTINYMSPEILKNEDYDERIDTWAYGCVLYEIIFLTILFKKQNDYELSKEIVEKEIEIPQTKEIYSVILKRSLEKNAIERAFMKDIKQITLKQNEAIRKYLIEKETNRMDKNNQIKYEKIKEIPVVDRNKIISESEDKTIKYRNLERSSYSSYKTTSTGNSESQFRMRIISGSEDKSIKIWDVESGTCIQTLTGHSDVVWCITVMDKNKIVSGGGRKDTSLKVWDVQSGSCLKTLRGHSKAVSCVALLDKNKIISGCGGGSIKIWDFESGSCLKTLTGHSGTVNCITVMDKHKIISGSWDKTIKVWDIDKNSCITTLTGHTDILWCMKLIFINKIITGSHDKTIKIWDVDSGSCIKTLTGHFSAVFCLEVMYDNKILSGSADKSIKVWDVQSGNCIKTLKGHDHMLTCITVLEKNKIISGSHDKTIKIWDVDSGSCIKTLNGHFDVVRCITAIYE